MQRSFPRQAPERTPLSGRASPCERPAGHELRLGPLPRRGRVPRDGPSRPVAQPALRDPERADGDVQLTLAPVAVNPADGAAVDAPRDGLEPGDEVKGRQLR